MSVKDENEWYTIYQTDPEWEAKLERVFNKSFRRGFDDPENSFREAYSRTLFVKLPVYVPKNRDRLDGLVITTFKMVVKDLLREVHGRPRPPKVIKEAGSQAIEIFELHCIRRLHRDVIVEQLNIAKRVVAYWVGWIEAGNRCGRRPVMESLTSKRQENSGEQLDLKDTAQRDPSEHSVSEELASLIRYLLNISDNDSSETFALTEKLKSVRSAIAFTDEERLIMQMKYFEELKIVEIARNLRLKSGYISNTLENTLKRIAQVFREYNITL